MTGFGLILLIIIAAAILIAFFAWAYQRATNEVSFVRTGLGGLKVVIDGGSIALPYFHEISRVNMQTIRMDVSRAGQASLITKDKLRIDVGAEFYASVIPDEAAVVRASQTLGRRTFQPDQLKALIEGMLVDALRSVAARMTLDELHENRSSFVADVQDSLAETLVKYGLQLDSVSLTALDQTPFTALDENNAFNAVGMRKLAEVVAKSKKERAEIESETAVAVRRAEVTANQHRLEIELEERRSEIAQTQEIEFLLASQLTEVARRKAEAEREAAHARIQMEKDIQAAAIAQEQHLREAEIAQSGAVEIAEQDKTIQLAVKSQEETKVKAEATSAARALIEAEESIETLRQMAEAERRKKLAIVSAEQEAEATATRARINSVTEQEVAKAKGAVRREEAASMKVYKLAEAEARAAHIEAENKRSEANIALETERVRLEKLPAVLSEVVKPVEKINGININHVSGLGRSDVGESGSAVDRAVDSIFDLAVGLPTLKKLGEQLGVSVVGSPSQDRD